MSDDRILQIISSVPALSQRITDLESRNSDLENRCSNLETQNCDLEQKHTELLQKHNALEESYNNYHEICEKRFNKGEQYTRRNCLILKKLPKVPTNIHGWRFSRYIVHELRKLFPSISVSYADLDTSHILYKDEEKKPVVVVKFVNRDLRNQYWNNRDSIHCKNVTLTEHLTPFNQALFTKAQEAGHVWTQQCKILATVNGEKN